MHINELNFYQNTFEEHRENDETNYESSFPLFNISALRESQVDFSNFNFYTSEKISEMVEEITTKKTRRNNGTELVVKQRGRKAIPKNGKSWNDPSITMKEIIENDLAGEPTVADLRAKEERLRKMREGKVLKRAQRIQGQNAEENATTIQENKNLKAMEVAVANIEQTNVPQIIFKDGKIVVEMGNQNQEKKLTLVEANTKPKKLNSMSFRTKNHANKWTEEETRKFYKAIEIFGADFSMIAKLFPTRNRDQVKNKYNKESKTNGKMVDEAFKKNAVLCKRSIMDRIKSFNTNLTALRDEGAENFELGMVSLERNGSNTSTDSMDLRVLEEIQEVFVKEMREVKAKNNSFNLLNGSTFTFNNTQTNTENNSETNEVEEVETVDNNNNANNNNVHVENTAGNQQENLLLRLFK